jgi:hypothetical protein
LHLNYILDLILCRYKLPEDGTLVPKHVGVFTYNAMCLMVFLFYLVRSVGESIECNKMHGVSNIEYKKINL